MCACVGGRGFGRDERTPPSTALLDDAAAQRAKYGRELNCLKDGDRNSRKRALGVFTDAAGSLSPTYVVVDLVPRLLPCLSDAVEKNRELAAVLLIALCNKHSGLVSDIARHSLPVLGSRIGSFPFPETTEEIRLLLVQLLAQFLRVPTSAEVVKDNFSVVTEILVRSSGDAFHDVKVKQHVGAAFAGTTVGCRCLVRRPTVRAASSFM